MLQTIPEDFTLTVTKPTLSEHRLYIQNAGQSELRCNVSTVNNPVPPYDGFLVGPGGPNLTITANESYVDAVGGIGLGAMHVARKIAAGQTSSIALRIKTSGAKAGRHFRQVFIRSNAASKPTLIVGLVINVQAYAVAGKSTAVGGGSQSAIVGERASFEIKLADVDGMDTADVDSALSARIVQDNPKANRTELQVKVIQEGGGNETSWVGTCAYNFVLSIISSTLNSSHMNLPSTDYPSAMGSAKLYVVLGDQNLVGSPFDIDIKGVKCGWNATRDLLGTQCLCAPGFEMINSVCRPCQAGFERSGYGSGACQRCPNLHYSTPGATNCVQCPTEGVSCEQGILALKNDVWYDTSKGPISSDTVFHTCPMRGSCVRAAPNGSSSIVVKCKTGYEGPLCNMCSDNRIKTGDQCKPCDPGWANTLFVLAFLAFAGWYIGEHLSKCAILSSFE